MRVFRAGDLAPADPTSGMTRSRAFEVPTLWAGRVETLPGAVSGWHHHDRNERGKEMLHLRFPRKYDGCLHCREG